MAHNMELTAKQKEKLFKLLPMSTTYKHKFTPQGFDNLPEQITPVFTITQLTTELMDIIKRMAVESQVRGKRQLKATALLKEGNERISTMYTVLEGCVVEWKNLNVIVDDKGNFEILPFAKESVRELPTETMASVFQEILVISGMGEAEDEDEDKSETSE